MLDNDRNRCCNLSPSRPAKARGAQRSETPRGASETPIARLARVRVSLRTACALAVRDKGNARKIVVDWPPNALRSRPRYNSQIEAK